MSHDPSECGDPECEPCEAALMAVYETYDTAIALRHQREAAYDSGVTDAIKGLRAMSADRSYVDG
jgi:hypothetical protein